LINKARFWKGMYAELNESGNVFPGATLPYGMAKAVADTNSGSNQGGFTTVCDFFETR